MAAKQADLYWLGLLLFGVLTNKYGIGNPHSEAWPRVKDLVSRGADVNARDHFRRTPAMQCCTSGNYRILSYLAANGADLDAVCIFSRTALHFASRDAEIRCVVILLNYGVALDKVDRSGATALWTACYRGNLEIVKLLVEHGANPNIKHNSKLPRYAQFNGYTPRDAAIWREHHDVIEYMNPRELNWRRRYNYARLLQRVKGAPTTNIAMRMLQCDDVARIIGSYL